jgi:hypothetical protein
MANNDDLLQENLRQLCALTSQISDVKERLTAQQSQLSVLQQKQRRVQEEQQQLNQQLAGAVQAQLVEQEKLRLVNELELAIQREIAINTQRLTAEAHIQTLNQQQTEVRRQRQQSFKNTFFTVRQTLDEYTAIPQPLIRFLLLQSLKDMVHKKSLLPDKLDEIADKEYAYRVLSNLEDVFDASMNLLTVSDQNDLRRWKELPLALEAIALAAQDIASREEYARLLPSLPSHLTQAKANLERCQHQHSEGAQKRREYNLRSKWAFLIALTALGAFIVGLLNNLIIVMPLPFVACLISLLAVTVIYGIGERIQGAKLDYTKSIQALQKECERLENEMVNTPKILASLEADKSSLRQKQQEIAEIYVRHPELHNFHLPQF